MQSESFSSWNSHAWPFLSYSASATPDLSYNISPSKSSFLHLHTSAVLSQLNYFNFLLADLLNRLLAKLQRVQNNAAPIVFCARTIRPCDTGCLLITLITRLLLYATDSSQEKQDGHSPISTNITPFRSDKPRVGSGFVIETEVSINTRILQENERIINILLILTQYKFWKINIVSYSHCQVFPYARVIWVYRIHNICLIFFVFLYSLLSLIVLYSTLRDDIKRVRGSGLHGNPHKKGNTNLSIILFLCMCGHDIRWLFVFNIT